MPDIIAAQRKALRCNIERYSRLLETELTEIERANLHKRMVKDWAVLSRLNHATDPTAGEDSAAPESKASWLVCLDSTFAAAARAGVGALLVDICLDPESRITPSCVSSGCHCAVTWSTRTDQG
jgi:hypothetical protein